MSGSKGWSVVPGAESAEKASLAAISTAPADAGNHADIADARKSASENTEQVDQRSAPSGAKDRDRRQASKKKETGSRNFRI